MNENVKKAVRLFGRRRAVAYIDIHGDEESFPRLDSGIQVYRNGHHVEFRGDFGDGVDCYHQGCLIRSWTPNGGQELKDFVEESRGALIAFAHNVLRLVGKEAP